MRALGLLAFVLLISAPANADDAVQLAETAASDLIRATEQLEEAETASNRILAYTKAVQAYEAGLSSLREGMRRAALRESELQAKLSAEDAELSQLLTMLQAVSRQAEGETLLHPGGALETIRAGTLTASLVPALQQKASVLQSDMDELQSLITVQDAGKKALEDGLDGVRTARLRLVEVVSQRARVEPDVSTDAATIEALVNSSETLSAFVDSLLPERERATWLGDVQWPSPVQGRLIRNYNEADAAGVRRPGWVFATESEALVTTPTAATVRFSSEIPGQGVVTVLEPEPGALLILAGLGQSFVQKDQIVAKDDPIGLMGRGASPEQEKLNESFAGSGLFGGETLYMEIRQGRTSVDPAGLIRLGRE